MKVSKAIEQLKEYNSDDEIVIMYWTRDLFEDFEFDEDNPISKELWDECVEAVENSKDLDDPSSEVYDALYHHLIKGGASGN
jgi:hypothetical protein